ncbi:hypothetical protein Nepgr_006224 [Nepenthes gracilis]|uniref:BHLH domain-containing protein n=1 Tax=Nepenthes gracilis TaxID=150966 RepID=A0AAD3S545_NEPGR|nr:hypothetical protein Nepgr_006224 [Nepenthes gracilis]
MVRAAETHYHHHHEVDDDDAEGLETGTDAYSQRDEKGTEQKENNPKSKHSETEQRRRSKINERFQILKDLIPPYDQKRDKASVLLEVIKYIQFLQEKLQMYEGPCQGWSQESTKLIPWRSNHGPLENFADRSQVIKNGFGYENNVVQPIANAQCSVESDASGDAAYRATEHHALGPATSAVPLNMPLQQSMHPSGKRNFATENLASQLQSQHWQGRALSMECAVGGNAPSETGKSNVSSVFSQGLLKSLTGAFQTSEMDLSQMSISVQLDIGKRQNFSPTAPTSAAEDLEKVSPRNLSRPGTGRAANYSDPAPKRLKTRES